MIAIVFLFSFPLNLPTSVFCNLSPDSTSQQLRVIRALTVLVAASLQEADFPKQKQQITRCSKAKFYAENLFYKSSMRASYCNFDF